MNPILSQGVTSYAMGKTGNTEEEHTLQPARRDVTN